MQQGYFCQVEDRFDLVGEFRFKSWWLNGLKVRKLSETKRIFNVIALWLLIRHSVCWR